MGDRITRRDRSLDYGNLEVRASFTQHVSSTQAAGSCADDDNVALSVSIQVLEVATSHSTRDLTLTNGIELEAVPFPGKFLKQLSLASDLHLAVDGFGGHGAHCWHDFGGDWWRHFRSRWC